VITIGCQLSRWPGTDEPCLAADGHFSLGRPVEPHPAGPLMVGMGFHESTQYVRDGVEQLRAYRKRDFQKMPYSLRIFRCYDDDEGYHQ
jgi:hypothetical protein